MLRKTLLVFLGSLLYGTVFAEEIPFTLKLKYFKKDASIESIVQKTDKGYFVPVEDFNAIYQNELNVPKTKIDGVEYYAEKDLGKFEVKEEYFMMWIELKNEFLPPQVFSFSPLKYNIKPQFYRGGYLNYDFNYDSQSKIFNSAYKFNYGYSPSTSVNSSFTYNNSNDTGGLKIQDFNLNYYNQEKNFDVKFGTYISPEGISNGFSKLGLKISSNFSADPAYTNQITQSFKGTAELEGVAELYINGAKIKQEAIRPGDFQWNGISNSGYTVGEAKLLIKDKNGKINEIKAPLAPSAKISKPGTYGYSLDLGYLRPTENTVSKLTGTASGSYGLTDWMTINGSVDFTNKQSLKNLGVSLGVGYGVLGLNYGLGVEGSGYGVSYNTSIADVGLSLAYNKKKDFVGLESISKVNSDSLFLGTQFSLFNIPFTASYSKINSSTSTNTIFGQFNENRRDSVFDVSSKFNLTDNISLGLNFQKTDYDKSFFISLNFNLDKVKVSNSYASKSGTLFTNINYNDNKMDDDKPIKFNYSANSIVSQGSKSYSGTVSGSSQYGSGSATLYTGGAENAYSLNYNGGLAIIDGGVIPANQITDSYVLFDSEIEGLKVFNNAGYAGKTNSKGDVVIPTGSFADNKFTFDPLSTPEDVLINKSLYENNTFPNSASKIIVKSTKIE